MYHVDYIGESEIGQSKYCYLHIYFLMLNLFSLYTYSSGDFIRPHDFKCHMYATTTQDYISRLYLFSELQTPTPTSLFGIFFCDVH